MSGSLEEIKPHTPGVLGRAQSVSQYLSDAARRARFSSRARGAYQQSGFGARRGARAMRIAMITLFTLTVVVPNIVSTVYFTTLASDQFVSEAKFTVSSGAIPKLDAVGAVTGVPALLIVQDTQIVTNYIESRALVELLDKEMNLRELFGSSSIDWWSRFRTDKPIEKLAEYWEKRAISSITFPSGVVTFSMRAFTPGHARELADTVIARCEALINNLNEKMRNDTVAASESDLARAGELLKAARINLENARNAEGILDIGGETKALYEQLTFTETELLKAQQELNAQTRYLSRTAPTVKPVEARVQALKKQLDELKARLTVRENQRNSTEARRSLNEKSSKLAELLLEQQIAEKRYASAAGALDAARILSERKMMYLHQIVSPALPEESTYPRRGLNIGMILLASMLIFAICAGLLSFVRNHMA